MKHESPAQSRASADGLNVVEHLTASERHGGRFANVTVDGMRRLGLHGTGLFGMGFACGRYFDGLGSFKRLNGLPVGSDVDPSRLSDVLALAGVSEKTWENNVSSWTRLRMAHRCKPGIVALFADPHDGAWAMCPKCSKPLDRGEAFPVSGSTSPVSREDSSRLAGESGHKSLVASNAERTVAGMAALPRPLGVQVRQDPAQEVFSRIAARIRREREFGLSDRDIAALLNQTATFPPPDGFVHWTGYAVRVAAGEVVHAA